ncbi:hypothetical protein MAMMFC1_02104 [Methylomusa anaerophila]|uniref:Uncharacterized protein n=1 Tax=Methylomusa anaerophila TaxID=1930071 RepID=A0A348AK22_9FIRM|nr:hypothetical protein MAMMFC1_02104 [Methylomusa anaerophila]
MFMLNQVYIFAAACENPAYIYRLNVDVFIQIIKCLELLRNRQMLGAMRTGTEAYWVVRWSEDRRSNDADGGL